MSQLAKLLALFEDVMVSPLRVQYQQLLEEGKEEVFEERRVNLLKAQVMQLERQVQCSTHCPTSPTRPKIAAINKGMNQPHSFFFYDE